MQGIVAELVGHVVNADQPLMEAGLDSIGSLELQNLVRFLCILACITM